MGHHRLDRRVLIAVSAAILLALSLLALPSAQATTQPGNATSGLQAPPLVGSVQDVQSSGSPSAEPSGPAGSPSAEPSGPVGAGDKQYQNGTTGLCLSIYNNMTDRGSPIVNWTCQAKGKGQYWYWPGDGTLRSTLNGLCLDVYGGNTHAGAIVYPWTCTEGNPNQQWEPISKNRLYHPQSELCLSVINNNTQPGSLVVIENCSTSASGEVWIAQ
ncbi:RICIN domain-containing protein [Micromonospora sp. RTGN7]|uniref:RICIN domain-containing protein n=1 Tax=Micromonospora sp. RTGN7 TaxID=3016526 RepID=UPI0029FF25AA|nr:RICIN domain-containing protein [Micromonospora sp. RTGN7]